MALPEFGTDVKRLPGERVSPTYPPVQSAHGGRVTLTGRLLARNALLNLAGQIAPIAAALVAIPVIVRGLGVERFGVLVLAWTLLGYLAVFDLGVGRATVRFAAQRLAGGDDAGLRAVVWTSLALNAALGILGGVLLALATPLLVDRVIRATPDLQAEATGLLLVIATTVPVTLIMIGARGILEAGQRFDLVNLVNAPSNALTYLLSAAGTVLGLPLPVIGVLLLLNRVVGAGANVALALRSYPALRETPRPDRRHARQLIGYGRWLTVSNLLSPILVYADRLVVSALLGIGLLGFYTVPSDMLLRLWIVPAAVTTTLFPALGVIGAVDMSAASNLYGRAMRMVLLTVAPLAVLGAVFGADLLRIWIGSDFARQGGGVAAVLALGVLVGALSSLPVTLIQSLGRPDLPAKLLAAEFIPYIAATLLLTSGLGLVGTAIAWTGRSVVELAVLAVVAGRLTGRQPGSEPRTRRALVAVFVLGIASALIAAASAPLALRLAAATTLFLGFIFAAWRSVIDPVDRRAILGAVGKGNEDGPSPA